MRRYSILSRNGLISIKAGRIKGNKGLFLIEDFSFCLSDGVVWILVVLVCGMGLSFALGLDS